MATVFQTNPRPGVTGMLPVANGGIERSGIAYPAIIAGDTAYYTDFSLQTACYSEQYTVFRFNTHLKNAAAMSVLATVPIFRMVNVLYTAGFPSLRSREWSTNWGGCCSLYQYSRYKFWFNGNVDALGNVRLLCSNMSISLVADAFIVGSLYLF